MTPQRAMPDRRVSRPPRSVLLAMEFYIHAVHEGVVRYARQAGWTLEAGMVHTHRVPEHWHGDGILCEVITRAMATRLAKFHRPMVALVTPMPGRPCPAVLMDNERCGRLAAEHFLERGFKRLAYFQPRSSHVIDARGKAFRQAALGAGAEVFHLDLSRVPERNRHRGHTRWLVERLRELPKPLGVMASSDQWAIEVLNACRLGAIDVPEQVAVIGVDNDPLYVEVAPVPLSSVDNDLHRCGYEAAAMLDGIMGKGTGDRRQGTVPSLVIEPIGVVTRKSTDILAVDNPYVAKAMGYLFAHFREPIRVGEVATHAGLPLRKLQSQFKEVVGRPIIDQLIRLRLDHACKLLLNTELGIEAVARHCGFASGKYLGKTFNRSLGQSPRHYRKHKATASGAST